MKTQEQIILDIGCGQKKMEGAIGIDFSPFSMADIILDLNKEKLPFEDNSVDYIYTSHNLEHLTIEGFYNIISEMYRVSKPDAQIYITVPYFTNTLNFANPFHNNQICFNEHTFRFFSSSKDCKALKKEEYQTPTCPDWGLRYSANSELSIEFETLKIEYLYFNKYKDKSFEEKMHLRQTTMNVVENITYWLKVLKPCPQLIIKKSQFEKSHFELISESFDYIEKQQVYIKEQQDFLNKIGKEACFNYEEILEFKQQEKLFIDRDGVLYPPIEIFWIYQNIIQNLQYSIDMNQKLIDNCDNNIVEK